MPAYVDDTATFNDHTWLFLDSSGSSMSTVLFSPNTSIMLVNVTEADQYKYFIDGFDYMLRDGAVHVNFLLPLPSISMSFVFAAHTYGADGMFTSIHGNPDDASYDALTFSATVLETHFRFHTNDTSPTVTPIPHSTSSTATSSPVATSSTPQPTTTSSSGASFVSASRSVMGFVILFSFLLVCM
eukprot:Phypoly_transcript_12916.p1 GENE.Phypoly_transcript_12916~~Phypoly_transcript_12916.p1  ORF type:complete len:185 (+),score=32.03 Phypoly_transcript_12916:515-1069(+)